MLKVEDARKSLILPRNLLVRGGHGASKCLIFLKPLDQESADQRMMQALLRGDRASADEICQKWQKSDDQKSLEKFCLQVTWGNLPALIYEQCMQADLSQSFAAVKIKDNLSLLDFLRERSAAALIESRDFSQRFAELLGVLGDISDHVIWLKGSSLSRLLYERPEQRLSVDFDLLVDQSVKEIVLEKLTAAGFSAIWDQPGFCHQSYVGPTGSLDALFLVPNKECEGCHNLTLTKRGWPYIELKFNPLDTGLKMKEQERFFQDRLQSSWKGLKFCAPSTIDHLLLALSHLHKHGFQGWAWLYDIHLLSASLPDAASWKEVVRRAYLEGIETSVWVGLALACDRLNTVVPDFVFAELRPKYINSPYRPFLLSVSTEFIWNCNSLPMLLLNATLLGDSKRKQKVLLQMFFPTKEFLANYYAGGALIQWWNYWYYLLLHWLVLICPGGLIRRTIGPFIWHS